MHSPIFNSLIYKHNKNTEWIGTVYHFFSSSHSNNDLTINEWKIKDSLLIHSAMHAFLSGPADPDSKIVVRVETMQCMGHNEGRGREAEKQSDGQKQCRKLSPLPIISLKTSLWCFLVPFPRVLLIWYHSPWLWWEGISEVSLVWLRLLAISQELLDAL